jgi:hypothetical protein
MSAIKTSFVAVLSLASLVQGQWDASRFAWYNSAGTNFASALPIGNGRVAGVVYGSASEKITLNENSVWSGPWQNRANSRSLGALSAIRQRLQNGDLTGAGQMVLENMAGNPTSPRAYNPTVDMLLDFGHSSGSISSYTRYLDTYQGTAFVTYNYGGVNYTYDTIRSILIMAHVLMQSHSREFVASHPAGVLAFRLSASQSGRVNVRVSLSRTQWVQEQRSAISNNIVGTNTVILRGNSGQASNPIAFTSEARVVNNGGEYDGFLNQPGHSNKPTYLGQVPLQAMAGPSLSVVQTRLIFSSMPKRPTVTPVKVLGKQS